MKTLLKNIHSIYNNTTSLITHITKGGAHSSTLAKLKHFFIFSALTLSLNTTAIDAHQAGEQITSQIVNKAISTTEGYINTQANEFANNFGKGRTSISIKGIDSQEPSYSIDTIQPISEFNSEIKELTFVQGSLASGENEGDRRNTLNLGLGQRYLVEDQRAIAGINLFVDYEGTSKHKRASLGLEYQRSNFSLNANKYYPITDKKVIGDYTEEVLPGHDINLTGQMPYAPWATIKGTHYYWDQTTGDNISGNILGVEIQLSPSTSIEFGQEDSNTTQKQSYAELSIKLPFDDTEKMTNFALDDQPFRAQAMMDLTSLTTFKRSNKIKIEKLLNNIAPVFTSSATANAAENQTTAITLVATDDQTIAYSISGTDSALFSVNSSTGVVTFATAPDYESPSDSDTNNAYAFTATATDAKGLSTTQSIVVTVTDVAEQGVTVSKSSMTVGEAGTNTYTLVLNVAPTANVVVTPASNNTNAATVSSALTFTTVNWAIPQTVTVMGVNDGNNINESVTVSHSATSSDTDYNAVSIASVAITLADDDTAGITASAISGNTTEGAATATFTLVLNTQPTADVTVALSSSDTTEGTVSPSSVTFTNANWNSTQTVTVTGVNDDVDDGDIVYSIVTAVATSTDSDYSGLNAADVSVTNTDNDTVGVTQSATSATIGEASTGSYTIALNTQPTADVTITLTSDDTTAATVTSSLTFTSVNWASAQTVTITGVNDADFVSETVTISHAISGGGYDAVSMTNLTATMTDDDVFASGDTFNGQVYLTVTSPDTGRVWLDRNLGATQVATSSTDSAAYGDLYQWGRATDGHESRTSTPTATLATTITPGTNTFITNSSSPYDWTTADSTGSSRTSAWAGAGANDICPAGFSVPTEAELTADTISATTTDITNSSTAFSSFLKIPVAGYRNRTNGALNGVGSYAYLWSRSADGSNGRSLGVNGSGAYFDSIGRAGGFSVRCIQD